MKKKKAYRYICFFSETIKEASRLFSLTIKEDVIDLAKKKGSDLLLAHVKNIIEKSSVSNLRFYVDMDFISY